jgi:transposase
LATDREFTRILDWPGYRVYQHQIDEKAKTLKLWIRRKRGNRRLECSGCGRKLTQVYDTSERAVRDLPWSGFTATVFVEVYRVHCPDCGVKREKVPLLPGKAPFSKRFEDAVGLACEMASARQVARQFGLAASTVRAIDLRYLERWTASRRTPALRQMGVDEIYLGKKQKFLSVVCNLETGEPLWFGRERKKQSLDGFFQTELSARQRRGIEAACVDMWKPYRLSIEQWDRMTPPMPIKPSQAKLGHVFVQQGHHSLFLDAVVRKDFGDVTRLVHQGRQNVNRENHPMVMRIRQRFRPSQYDDGVFSTL